MSVDKSQDAKAQSSLHKFARHGNVEAVTGLIERFGGNAAALDAENRSALHHATDHQDEEASTKVCKVLLKADAGA